MEICITLYYRVTKNVQSYNISFHPFLILSITPVMDIESKIETSLSVKLLCCNNASSALQRHIY